MFWKILKFLKLPTLILKVNKTDMIYFFIPFTANLRVAS